MKNVTKEVIRDLKNYDKVDRQMLKAEGIAQSQWNKITRKAATNPEYAHVFNLLRFHEIDELEDILKKDHKGIVTVANFALVAAIFGYLKHEGVLDELQTEGPRVFKKLVKKVKSHAK